MDALKATVIAMSLCLVFVFFNFLSPTNAKTLTSDFDSPIPRTKSNCPYCGKCSWCRVRNQTVFEPEAVRPLNKYPWMAALFNDNGSFICGGAIISATFIVTAAHCVLDYDMSYEDRCEGNDVDEDCFISPNRTVVKLPGREEFQSSMEIKKIIPYKSFDHARVQHDIALVELKSPIKCNRRVFPICLPTRNLHKIGKNILVVGWEKHWHDQSREPIELQESWLIQYPTEMCFEKNAFNDLSSTICTSEKVWKTVPCLGDAGTLAVSKFGEYWILLGVRYFDIKSKCFRLALHQIYARMFKYILWIKHVVKDLSIPVDTYNFDECGRRIPGLEGVRRSDRIINGRQVKPPFKYPWVVKVEGDRTGSGSIINERYILTSAFLLTSSKSDGNIKCKDGKMAKECYVKKEDLKVRLPWKDSTKFRKTLSAEELLPHPDYDHSCKKNDIALVKVSEDIECNSFKQPICLPTTDLKKLDGRVTILGWGKITADGTKGSKVLREGEMRQVDFAKNCQMYECFDKNTTKAICAVGAQRGHTPCQGDSGAAIFAGFNKAYHALGVTSLPNENSCDPTKPLFFSKVHAYMEWIKKFVKKFPEPYKNFVKVNELEIDDEPAES